MRLHGAVELKSYRSIGQWQPSADLGVDPIEFRLRYLLNDARATDVLKAVAEKSQWRRCSSPALTTNATTAIGTGIAVTRRSGGYAAAVAEVDVNKFPDVPALDIVLINRQDVAPPGAGELSTVPTPAAIANAIFDATGARMREMPFTPKRVLEALETA